MPTVVDSLVVQFSLDASKFTQGQQQVLEDVRKMQDAAQRAALDTEVATKKLGDVFTTMKRELIGFAGIAIGGAEARQFFDYIVNLDAANSRLSRTLGVNIQDIAAWQSAARQFGGTGQEVTNTISRLTQEVWNFRFGAGSNLPGQLRPLGINVFDQGGNPKNGIELLREMATAVEAIPGPTAGKAAYLKILGIDDTSINLVIRGRAELEKTLATMRELNPVTAESGREAEAYQASLGRLDAAATGLGHTFVRILGPALATVFDAIAKLMSAMGSGSIYGAGERAGVSSAPHTGFVHGLVSAVVGPKAADEVDNMFGSGGGTPSAGAVASAGGSNWGNFLSGLSFLETDQRNVGNSTSSAQGYFQFLSGTAAKARAAGLNDPRVGSYADQSASARAYIEKFYPQAAAAIARGDFQAAAMALHQEWPSLPGGSQQQSASRYATYEQELRGGGPRPAGSNITVQQLIVNSRADNAAGIAGDIKTHLTDSSFVAQAPQGLQ